MTANAVSGEETGLVVKWPKVTQLITGRTRGGAQSLQVPRSGLLTTGDMPAPVRTCPTGRLSGLSSWTNPFLKWTLSSEKRGQQAGRLNVYASWEDYMR